MRTTLLVTAFAIEIAVSVSAFALTPAKPNPIAVKYSDAGAKPAIGRSGSAAIEVRALLGSNGATDLEVTTGKFESLNAPKGKIDKVQVKLLNDAGEVRQTDNYRKTRTGNGYVNVMYENLLRGQLAQVQINVSGIDPNRTDVVTVPANVKLRPDIEAVSLVAPSRALVNTPVFITGLMSESNGDVGAHATCELLVDNSVVAAIPAAWVDAGSSVSCLFQSTFASAGSKNLTMRIVNVAPADFDSSNNSVTAILFVSDATEPFNRLEVGAGQNNYSYDSTIVRTFRRDGGQSSTQTMQRHQRDNVQWAYAYGRFAASTPLDGNTLALTHSMDGTPLQPLAFDTTTFANRSYYGTQSCAWTIYETQELGQICSEPGLTHVWAQLLGGQAVYTDVATEVGDFSWYGNWSNSFAYDYGPRFAFGTNYSATLSFESPSTSRTGTLSATMQANRYSYANNYCYTPYWNGYGYEDYCESYQYWNEYQNGWASSGSY